MSADSPTVTVQTAADGSVLVAFARLEGKVDDVLTRHDARLETLEEARTDHEARLRSVEARPTVPPVVEERLRALEDRRTVSPQALWLAVTSGPPVGRALQTLLLRPGFAPMTAPAETAAAAERPVAAPG